ncbi:unnamed protein product [Protopolystoma xenopodis]|uniref:Uncharacterized protein n=1 Tax=Protopolystoma xenopodis TaxID=117903 RepID=A0A448WG11_9PLAT|nr:unnamed protein product [Protopolystoma xenopodis]
MVLQMARLTDDAGETSGKVPCPRLDFENDHVYNGLRTRCVFLSPPINMTKLRRQGQKTSIDYCSDDVIKSTGKNLHRLIGIAGRLSEGFSAQFQSHRSFDYRLNHLANFVQELILLNGKSCPTILVKICPFQRSQHFTDIIREWK